MTMQQTIRSAARLRQLTDKEFEALRRFVETGEEPLDETTLSAVCEALADCADVVRAEEPPTTTTGRGSQSISAAARARPVHGPRLARA